MGVLYGWEEKAIFETDGTHANAEERRREKEEGKGKGGDGEGEETSWNIDS